MVASWAVPALAALAPTHAQANGASIEKEIRAELTQRHTPSFEALLSRWQSEYGTKAVEPLLSLASDRNNRDPDRYVALMGATKIGGKSIASAILPFLKDPSWMLRSGGLRALSALHNVDTLKAPLALLKDPALVVRVEAVEAVKNLHPPGAELALTNAALDPINFHAGKAQWVPGRALEALVELKALRSAPRLAPLLDHKGDPALQKETVAALEQITGQKLKPAGNLAAKVQAWKAALRSSPKT